MTTNKTVNKNYIKLPAKLSEETPWNKLCVDHIGPYKIHRKGGEASNVKIHYNDRPRNQVFWIDAVQQQESDDYRELGRNCVAGPVQMASRITYDQGGEFLGH